MATESLNTSGPLHGASGFSADFQANMKEPVQKRPHRVKTMLRKLIALLKPSPAKRKPRTTEEQIIENLAEKHSTIFLS
ncbi:MAG TPA: hypothetical protein VN371_09675 [Chlorobaculum sp.]|nr:hypothetical protein [Chlorobaculum sp.]